VIDDDLDFLRATARVLGRAGFEVIAVPDPVEGLMAAAEPDVEVVLSDVEMPALSGLQLLQELKAKKVAVEVVLMTSQASVSAGVAAVKAGAFDYLTKPFHDEERLVLTLTKAAEHRALRHRASTLEGMLSLKENFEDLIGRSPKMAEVFKMVDAVAPSNSTVMIQGESGTGKELIARALHRRSARHAKPFLAINCGALTETLLESELFGHVKGSFTGALTSKKGLFQSAHGGTVFLDEIGDMPLSTQVRLLRTLQEGEVRAVGATDNEKVDVRIICATHVDLQKAKAAGRLREDFFYRINVIALQLPPLRDRPEDIRPLVEHFIERYARRAGKKITGISGEALDRLVAHSWPGNVRELENVIERAVVLTRGGEIAASELPAGLGEGTSGGDIDVASLAHLPMTEARALTVGAFERRYTMAQLRRTQGNISQAADLAGMDRSNFRRLLKEHGIAARAEPEDA
jgi:DNA-binding NtrC family response regulator